MTTIKEIAQESGYSSATVSRLLNNDPNLSITADTKNKILEIANKLGYWKDHQEKKIRPTIALLYRVNHEEQLQDEYFTVSVKFGRMESNNSGAGLVSTKTPLGKTSWSFFSVAFSIGAAPTPIKP